jgi:alpha-galactosidase
MRDDSNSAGRSWRLLLPIASCLLTALVWGAPAFAEGPIAWADLAKTPPMGWNSWNKFGCDVSDVLIREVADALVASGMHAAGYQYVVIDDCWQVGRDEQGRIVVDPTRFPNGMKPVADYVHGKGLKFGIYSDAGAKTCQGRPGSNGYEDVDAFTYAAWGVDYLKYDWCSNEGVDVQIAYTTMRDALRATRRPIVFSMCEWGNSKPWTWARGVAHLWRTTTDILDCWDCTPELPTSSMSGSFHPPGPALLDQQVALDKYAGPGGWNDPDMLEVGNSGLTIPESRAHFSMWAMLAAPLMAGNDVRTMTPEVRAILTNTDVIAIDQDPLGRQGHKIRDEGDFELWTKPLQGGDWAVALLNRGKDAHVMSVAWPQLGLAADAAPSVTDLWTKQDHGAVKVAFSATVPSHDVVLVRVSPAR